MRTYLIDEKALRIRRWYVLEAGSATQRRQGACLLLSSRDHARRPTASGPAALPNLEELNTTPIDRWQRSIWYWFSVNWKKLGCQLMSGVLFCYV